MANYVTTVEYDVILDEYFIELPQPLLDQQGWNINDTIVWNISSDGVVTMTKVE